MDLIQRKQSPEIAVSDINQPSFIENDHIIDISNEKQKKIFNFLRNKYFSSPT